MSSDELEEKGLIVICKHCNSANIMEIPMYTTPAIKEALEVCGNCGTVDYTTIVTEEEFERILDSETIK